MSVGGAGGFPVLEVETVDRYGRRTRHFPVAVSAEVMALSWANREDGPQGALVVVDHEIRPSGLHGRIWRVPSTDTLACSFVLRPALSVEAANSAWLVAALAAANGASAATGRDLATWWPDSVIDTESREVVSAVRAEIQLGPGRVKSAVVTLRFDLPKLGLDNARRDELLEAVATAIDEACEGFEDNAAGAAAAYESRCGLIGNRVKIKLLPKGETRGTARGVDRGARLELESASGIVEKITVDQVGVLDVV